MRAYMDMEMTCCRGRRDSDNDIVGECLCFCKRDLNCGNDLSEGYRRAGWDSSSDVRRREIRSSDEREAVFLEDGGVGGEE